MNERIWLPDNQPAATWTDFQQIGYTEYIRADLHAERIAGLKEQLLRDDDSYQDLETRLREEIDRANRMEAERDALEKTLDAHHAHSLYCGVCGWKADHE